MFYFSQAHNGVKPVRHKYELVWCSAPACAEEGTVDEPHGPDPALKVGVYNSVEIYTPPPFLEVSLCPLLPSLSFPFPPQPYKNHAFNFVPPPSHWAEEGGGGSIEKYTPLPQSAAACVQSAES